MAKMSEKRLSAVVTNALQAASPEGSSAERFKEAIDYYHGHMPANKPGRSQLVSTDIADMTEATLAQLMPSFTNDQLVSFEALSEEDVQAAEEESEAVNHVIMELNNGYMLFNMAIKNAALKRNAFVRVEVVTKEDSDTQRFKALTPEALRQLTEEQAPRAGIEIVREYGDIEKDGDLTNIKVKTIIRRQKLEVSAVDPAYMIVTKSWDQHSLQECPLVAEQDYMTRSDLLERGFDEKKVMKLESIEDAPVTNAVDGDTSGPAVDDKAGDLIEVYRVYMKVDFDGDNVAERREIWVGGGMNGTILSNEPKPFVPYANGCLFIMPNTWEGISLFDKLKGEQKAKTATIRHWADNNATCTYGRYLVQQDEVNYGDIMNGVPGGLIRASNIDAVKPMPTVDIGPSAAMLMGYMDKMRTEKGGASLDMQGAESQIVGDTARGIERQFSSKEQLCEMMAQNMAETLVKDTALLVHRALRTDATAPLIIKRGDEWMNTSPSQWQERDRVNVTLGASLQARERLMGNIEKMIGFGIMLKQAGMGTTLQDSQGIYQMIKEWGYSANLNNPDAFWIDPRSKRGKQMAQNAQRNAEQQAKQQAEVQMMMMKFSQHIESQKNRLEWNKFTKENQFKYFDAWLSAEIEEAKIVGQATLTLEQAQQQARLRFNERGNDQQTT